ncbi:MAG: hypothetical protein IPO21_21665 [Bacteroidales bacterium]|nr:hypothetical protein [Bacteroidales bacterium]
MSLDPATQKAALNKFGYLVIISRFEPDAPILNPQTYIPCGIYWHFCENSFIKSTISFISILLGTCGLRMEGYSVLFIMYCSEIVYHEDIGVQLRKDGYFS